MGRERRVQIEGAIYHVISKGVSGKNIFLDSESRNYFLKVLGELSIDLDVDIYSYVLMSNHYHLLFKTNKGNISKFMHKLNTSYSHYFNYRYMQNGHLFHDRFKAFLVKDDQYFIAALRYIALNPVLAQVVKNPESYEWSSFKYLFNKEVPPWLKLHEALTSIGFKRDDFVSIVKESKQNLLELEEFKWETIINPEKLEMFIKTVLLQIGSLDLPNNKILRDCLIFYLKEKGFKAVDIAKNLEMSREGMIYVSNKVRLEIEKGNPLYIDTLDRLKKVFFNYTSVPGTGV
jgi:REP element-mobilizing transposase RayT